MEDEAKAGNTAIGNGPISIRSPERVMTSDAPPVELPHGWAFGRYELLGRIAYGGMAEIYLARESAYGLATRYVVIKRVLPHISSDSEFVGLFMDEARVAMSLTHPHISHINEFGRIDGSYFLAMEWVNGVALNQLIRRSLKERRRLPIPYAVKIIAAVAEALDYAHAATDEQGRPLGIIHRDVTPHNVMVTFDGSVKLLDFGIALATSRSTATRTGLVRGKLAYMSPQQCLAKEIDGRSDIFSLGVCLYEAVTGRRLYRRETDFEVCEAILRDPVPSIRSVDHDLPEDLDLIIQRCLAKNPQSRYQRAGELQTALESYLADHREVVTMTALGGCVRDLFPEQFANGPKLDTKTDLLNSLPRIQDGSGSRAVISSAPPTTRTVKLSTDRLVENDVTELPSESTGSNTRTVAAAPIGQGVAYALLGLLGVAVALGGVAVWFLARQPGHWTTAPSPGATQAASVGPAHAAPSLPSAPAAQAPSAPLPEPAPITAAAGSTTPQPANEASPNAHQGSVWITSDPPGAAIYINGNATGLTTPARLPDFWPGSYRLTLRLQGYEEHRSRVKVEAGQVAQASAHLMTKAEAREFYRRRAERPDGSQDDLDPSPEGDEVAHATGAAEASPEAPQTESVE